MKFGLLANIGYANEKFRFSISRLMVKCIPFNGKNWCSSQREVIGFRPLCKRNWPQINAHKNATSRLAFGGKTRMWTFYLHNQYLPVTQIPF